MHENVGRRTFLKAAASIAVIASAPHIFAPAQKRLVTINATTAIRIMPTEKWR